MSRIAGGQAALIARQKVGAVSGNVTTYTRKMGGVVALTGKAWVGRTVFSRLPNETGGGAIVWGDRDYLVSVADLALGGVPFDPERGDRVSETIAGVVMVFEVLAPLNEPSYRRSDQTYWMWRIHTKEQKPVV